MPGPKLNEGATVVGERPGTRATARYLRVSASKAREVLNLIRGQDVRSADEILQFTDRHVAADVRKVLNSAIANAINNDDQDAEELYVQACFADEGPTLRRFRPRARGRATRINKRTCHITIIVARMEDERLELIQARDERASGGGRPQSSAASRRARVARSRERAAEDSGEDLDEETTDDALDAVDDTDETVAENTTTDEADEAVAEESDVAAEAEDSTEAALEEVSEAAEADTSDDEAVDAADQGEEATEADEDSPADVTEAAEGSASDEAESDEDKNVSEAAEGSASDEADASRGGSEADDEGAK